MESIGFYERDWVRDDQGFAHAIRQTEWPHHSAYCGKYLKGEFVPSDEFAERFGYGGSERRPARRCPECCDRLSRVIPATAEDDDRGPPRCVILGRGVEREVGRRGKR